MQPKTEEIVTYFMLKLAAARHGADIVPDELCEHVQLGTEMAGGVMFKAETPPKTVGMCQECVEWCNANFDNLQPLLTDADRAALGGSQPTGELNG